MGGEGKKPYFYRLSLVSLSVFSLVPDLLFDCSRVLEYAKIQTVLRSRLDHYTNWTSEKGLTASTVGNIFLFKDLIPSVFSCLKVHAEKENQSFHVKGKIIPTELGVQANPRQNSRVFGRWGISFIYIFRHETCENALFFKSTILQLHW